MKHTPTLYHWKSSRTQRATFAVFRASKRLQCGVLVHVISLENDLIPTGTCPPSPSGTCNLNPKKLENAAGNFCTLKRLQCGELVHVISLENDLILTETCPPSPPGTSNLNPKKLKNMVGNFDRLLHIKYTLFRPISIYLYLGKRPSTHHVRWWRVPCCHACHLHVHVSRVVHHISN